MHLPDGFASLGITVPALAVSAVAVKIASARLGDSPSHKLAPRLGITSAFIFAAQSINIPVMGGVSAHFIGASLVCALLGPAEAVISMSAVILAQSFLGDGGLTALGLNFFNIALTGIGITWLASLIANSATGPGTIFGRQTILFAASFIAVVITGVLVSVELAVSGVIPFGTSFLVIGPVSVVEGLAEAGVTCAAAVWVSHARPGSVAYLNNRTYPGKPVMDVSPNA